MFPSCQNKENCSFQYLFHYVAFCCKHLTIRSLTEQWVHVFISAWVTWVSASRNLAALLWCCTRTSTQTSRTAELLTFWTVRQRLHETPVLILKLSHVWMFCCTRLDSGPCVWLTVICFVSWWWRPVIDGRGPGHLRSTAVDSSEIESSSRSVTMSSLHSWLGRQPSKTPKTGGTSWISTGATNVTAHGNCAGVKGEGLKQEYIPDNYNYSKRWRKRNKENWIRYMSNNCDWRHNCLLNILFFVQDVLKLWRQFQMKYLYWGGTT